MKKRRTKTVQRRISFESQLNYALYKGKFLSIPMQKILLREFLTLDQREIALLFGRTRSTELRKLLTVAGSFFLRVH